MGAVSSTNSPKDFKSATLYYHNLVREAHGAEPLEWDDECAKYAQMCADQCAANDTLGHDFTEKEDGEHMGQNAAMCYPDLSEAENARMAVQMWYDEVNSPGYNYEGDFGAGHFTQVVWKATTKVGAAWNGKYVIANYTVGGNMQGDYADNVDGEADASIDISELYQEKVDPAALAMGAANEFAGDYMEE